MDFLLYFLLPAALYLMVAGGVLTILFNDGSGRDDHTNVLAGLLWPLSLPLMLGGKIVALFMEKK